MSTYVYRPLGGNRKGLPRTCVNLFLTFLVSGLWHGAAWTFVLWGALHGLFVVGERIAGKRFERIPAPIRVLGTFLIVNALWVLFRAESFSQALAVYKGMISFGNLDLAQLDSVVGHIAHLNFPAVLDIVYLIGYCAILLGIVFKGKNSFQLLRDFRPDRRRLIAASLLFSVAILCLTRESVFIYFNF